MLKNVARIKHINTMFNSSACSQTCIHMIYHWFGCSEVNLYCMLLLASDPAILWKPGALSTHKSPCKFSRSSNVFLISFYSTTPCLYMKQYHELIISCEMRWKIVISYMLRCRYVFLPVKIIYRESADELMIVTEIGLWQTKAHILYVSSNYR